MTGSYCLSVSQKSHQCHKTSSFTVCAQCPPPARTQALRRWRHLPTAHSITVWLRVAHSLLRHFSSLTSEILVR